MQYSVSAVQRARDGARDWILGNEDGYPRSWSQEAADTERRGYEMYDDLEAPPIAGYEALERDKVVVRMGIVMKMGQERVHFRRAPTLME